MLRLGLLGRSFRARSSRALRTFCAFSEKYERKTPLEHVLLRPGMYVGRCDPLTENVWLRVKGDMKLKQVEYIPAVLKLFDEILVNAADNKQRGGSMTRIAVEVARSEDGGAQISVYNDGKSIPITLHAKENMHIPQLIFGNLLTGSNFSNVSNRFTGGRHGFGAKLTNIFSKEFVLEIGTGKGKKYTQRWTDNMHTCEPPEIVDVDANEPAFTKVTFTPDVAKFGLKALDDTHIELMKRRCYDVAACIAPIQVTYNGEEIPVSSFKDYAQLFLRKPKALATSAPAATAAAAHGGDSEQQSLAPMVSVKLNPQWELAVARSPTSSFEHMSFVNCMHTPRGGSHVAIVASQLTKAIEDAVQKQGHSCSPAQIRNKLFVFLNCLVENPAFDSQTKEMLTSKLTTMGPTAAFGPTFLKQITTALGIVEELVQEQVDKEQAALLRAAMQNKRKATSSTNMNVHVPKLEDAHLAGGPQGNECTLILTEGDSAKALAVAGLEVVGRDSYGVIPLRGKLLNVRDASAKQLAANEEILNLCTAMGLDFNATYDDEESMKGLRYGKVMIMTDQDHDGSHIKGLLINFFEHFWPNLLKREGFLQQFVTPLVKAFKGSDVQSFYSMQEFEQWQAGLQGAGTRGWRIKYYKGLGTSSAQEAKEYFSNLEGHKKLFVASGKEHDVIDKVFNKHRAADRRQWIEDHANTEDEAARFIDPAQTHISFEEFVDRELIHFSNADNVRSIPNAIDGLKPSQRKVLFGCFKRKLTHEMKVVQLAGYIAEHTAYHHGEQSLHSTIVNMAQDYVGSNNVPLLIPSGQFGTRFQGGKDFASPRYIFTRLAPIARQIFPEADDALLNYLDEDGQQVEPKFFVPIIPYLLVNGVSGIGTGWSTSVPSYDPLELVRAIQDKIQGKDSSAAKLKPWARGFQGTIDDGGLDSFVSSGVIERTKSTMVRITEIPLGKSGSDYKDTLRKLIDQGAVKAYKEGHTSTEIMFEVMARKADLDGMEKKGLLKSFKLENPIHTSNMHAFDADNHITRYASPQDVIDEYFPIRLGLYEKRRSVQLAQLEYESAVSRNKARFIEEATSGKVHLFEHGRGAVSRDIITGHLAEHGFEPEDVLVHQKETVIAQLLGTTSDDAPGNFSPSSKRGYDYLLDMPIHSLTSERRDALLQHKEKIDDKLQQVRRQTANDVWSSELTSLGDTLSKHYRSGTIKY